MTRFTDLSTKITDFREKTVTLPSKSFKTDKSEFV